jgi:hypothetical protein
MLIRVREGLPSPLWKPQPPQNQWPFLALWPRTSACCVAGVLVAFEVPLIR